MGGILGSLGIDPFYLFVILFVLQVAIIVLLCLVYDKYNRLQNSYNVFMKGKNVVRIHIGSFEECFMTCGLNVVVKEVRI